MSIASPVYGLDLHAEYQRGFDFARAAKEGYKFAIHKTSQGLGYVPSGFADFFRRSDNSLSVSGFYHFLERGSSGVAQADHFIDTMARVGGPSGRLVAVDFEAYGDLSPTNEQLEDFIRRVKARTNNHAIILYSSVSFWNSGTPSGSLSRYGADVTWEARYPDMLKHRAPKLYYQAMRRWYGWNVGFGGVKPWFWQFTSTGLVSGQYVDVNAYRGDMGGLMALTTRAS